MKKILCFIDNLGAGGAQRQMIYMAVSLKNAGYNVKIITYFDTLFYDDDIRKYQLEYECVSKADKSLSRIWYINKAIKSYDPDVVISYLDTPCIISCICRLIQRKKWNLIVSERNTTQVVDCRERVKFFLYSKLANLIVPNSYAQEEFIKKEYPALSEKIRVIVNMVDINRFVYTGTKRASSDMRIVVAASVIPSKNTKGFIRAIKNVVDSGVSNFKVDWFGYTGTEYNIESTSLIAEYNISEYIQILPKTTNIADEYRNSDWFCLPSFHEGTPNVICEAMACGLPVICSDVCDNSHYVTDSNGYLFNPESIDSMSAAIIKAINTCEVIRDAMGKQSRKVAESKLSYEVFSKHYIDAVKSVISSH